MKQLTLNRGFTEPLPARPAVSRYAWVLLAYLGLGLLLTWPMAGHLATHVPGDGIDDPSLAWNLWWVKHALVDQPQNPFAVTWQFWPVGINLAFYTLTVLNGMLGVPLAAAFGVLPAYNLLLLSSFVLGGFGAYLLSLEFIRRGNKGAGKAGDGEDGAGLRSTGLLVYLPPFLAGAFYAFASAKLFYAALGQGNIASSQWIPFAALYILRAVRPAGRPRDAVLAAFFIVLQAYAELTYASFLLIFVAFAVIWRLGGILLARRGSGSSHVILSGFTTQSQSQQIVSEGSRSGRRNPSQRDASRSLAARHQGGDAGNGLRVTRGNLGPLSRLALRLVLMALIFLVGIAPILGNMLPDLRAEGDFFTSGGGFADIFSADLAGYLVPTQLHPLLGGIVKAWSQAAAQSGAQFAVDKGQQIYVGYVALALALLGLWRGQRRGARRGETWFWAASAAVFFLLTLGPNLRIAGRDTGLPLPFRVLEALPFFKGNRYPSRYGVMLLLSLAPLVAAGMVRRGDGATRGHGDAARQRATLDTLRPTLHATLFPGFLLLLLLFEHLSAPLPISDLRVPALYTRIAAEAGDFAVLELPPGWRNGARVAGKQDVIIMTELWNQTVHGKRVLGGNTSRNPEFKFQYFSEDPTLARLIAQTNAADLPQHDALRVVLAAAPVTDQARAAARDWAAFTRVRYVMVHRDKLPAATEEALRSLLPVSLVGEEGSLALYRLDDDSPPQQTFLLGTDGGRKALAEGWSPPAPGAVVDAHGYAPEVYAERREVRLLLPLDAAGGTIALHGWSFAPDQQVTLVVDGRAVGAQPLPETPTTLTFIYPARNSRPPLSDIRLRFSHLADAAIWTQRMSVMPSSLLVRSAGQETGDFGHIYVQGVERSPNQRGYNLVALRSDGALLAAASFDTHLDATAGARLAAWVDGLPAGAWVAGAARDEASMNLGQDAVDALRTLGVVGDVRGHFRWGHAFIGRKGALPGAVLEQMDAIRPAQVSAGLPLSSPQVAAAVDSVQVR